MEGLDTSEKNLIQRLSLKDTSPRFQTIGVTVSCFILFFFFISFILEAKVDPIKKDIAKVEADIAKVEADIAKVKADISALGAGQAKLEAGQDSLKSDIAEIKNLLLKK